MTWACSAVIEVDDNSYYYAVNEMFSQWKQIFSDAFPIFENAPDDGEFNIKWKRERCKEMLQLPVIELKPAPHKESA